MTYHRFMNTVSSCYSDLLIWTIPQNTVYLVLIIQLYVQIFSYSDVTIDMRQLWTVSFSVFPFSVYPPFVSLLILSYFFALLYFSFFFVYFSMKGQIAERGNTANSLERHQLQTTKLRFNHSLHSWWTVKKWNRVRRQTANAWSMTRSRLDGSTALMCHCFGEWETTITHVQLHRGMLWVKLHYFPLFFG